MKYISVQQASNKLGVSVGTIYNYCKNGILSGMKISGKKKNTWKVKLISVEKILEKAKFEEMEGMK